MYIPKDRPRGNAKDTRMPKDQISEILLRNLWKLAALTDAKNKSMGKGRTRGPARTLVHTFHSSELLALVLVFGVMKKFVNQVRPHFPALCDANPSVLSMSMSLSFIPTDGGT